MPLFQPGILTEQMLGEVRYVKTCQVRSGRSSRWLPCRKALGKLPLFGETTVCTVQNQPALCVSGLSVFCDFSCFLTTVFTVKKSLCSLFILSWFSVFSLVVNFSESKEFCVGFFLCKTITNCFKSVSSASCDFSCLEEF